MVYATSRIGVAAVALSVGLIAGCGGHSTGVALGSSSSSVTGSAVSATGSASASSAGSATGTVAGCTDLVVTAAVKAAVTAAYRATDPAYAHLVVNPGDFYYGACSGVDYAATTFGVPVGDTDVQDQVATQDDGATRKYFSSTGGAVWRFLGGNAVEPSYSSCADTTWVPAGLRTLWHGCPSPADQGVGVQGSTSQGSTSQATASPGSPTLGVQFRTGTQGYGAVRPATVDNGGDPTGMISGITWSGWGGARATGQGTSEYVAPNQITAAGTEQSAVIVAFDLGLCGGRTVYREVEWYFPQHGEQFDAGVARNTCTGEALGSR